VSLLAALRKHWRSALIVLTGFVAGIAVVAAIAVAAGPATPTTTASADADEPASSAAPSTAPSHAPPVAPDTFKTALEVVEYFVAVATTEVDGPIRGSRAVRMAPVHRADGYGFWTYAAHTAMGFEMPREGADRDHDLALIDSVLTDRSFFRADADLPPTALYHAVYEHSDIVCQVDEWRLNDGDPTVISVGCADTSAYTDAAELQPFFELYQEAGLVAPTAKYVLSEGITYSSPAPGYQSTNVGVEELVDGDVQFRATALFYGTPDNSWHYFADTTGEPLSCAQYSGDALKAFSAGTGYGRDRTGSTCLDEATGAIVAVGS
jgi:hypothetical protein